MIQIRATCTGCGEYRRCDVGPDGPFGALYCGACAENVCLHCGAILAVHVPACPLCGTDRMGDTAA